MKHTTSADFDVHLDTLNLLHGALMMHSSAFSFLNQKLSFQSVKRLVEESGLFEKEK